MKCLRCQSEISDDSNFCKECGYDLKKAIKTDSGNYAGPQSYTPKHLADKILKSKSSITGERKFVTVLFADVASFTSISEKLDPEQVHTIMDGCFKILMDEIHGHKGTINQFTGDGVMALFGAPLALEDHAQDACLAALAIQKSMKQYSSELQKQYNIDFQMRIGINSGSVVVGAIGDDLRMDYTAVGDTTNLAARMESNAKPGTILVSPNTYNLVRQQFDFVSLGAIKIKGKLNSIAVYELIKEKISRPRLGHERQIYSEMVGRDLELNKLELQVSKTIDGAGSVVNVIGEAGIGKSRLIAELKDRDVMKRVTLLEGRAISIGRNLSFHPIIDLLRHWARISEDDNEASAIAKLEMAIRNVCQQEADEVMPFVAKLMGMKLTGRYAERVKGIEGEALEKLILKNVKDLLIAVTKLTPLVIIIEDLHWADTSSIELLESVFRLAETQRILFVNVFRPDHKETGDRVINTIKEKLPVYYVEINLEPLNEQMGEILIDNMLKIKGLHLGVKNKIVERSGGNPFFIEEVVRSFIDEGAVVVKNGNFEVTDKIESMIIPHTINDVLMARIDRLEDETRDLIKMASVIGRNFFHRILSEVAKSVQEIDKRLSHLKEIQLIRERKRMEELEYLFKHALAQEVAYESILLQKRKELHLQVAKSIESIFKKRIHEFYGMLALHYLKAEKYEKAEHYLVKAGEEAISASASNEALIYYQEGLKLFLQHNKDSKDHEKLAMFEKNIAVALYNKCRWGEAVEHFDNVFKCWNINIFKNRFFILIKAVLNIILIMTGLYRYFVKLQPTPNPREREILDLLNKTGSAIVFLDNIQLFFTIFDSFNRALKINIAKSPEAIRIFGGAAAVFSYSGLSFKVSYKMLEIAKNKIAKNNIQNLMAYAMFDAILNCNSGNWSKIGFLNEQLLNDALKTGDLWDATGYMVFFFTAKIDKGDFYEAELSIDKLNEIAIIYNYNLAAVYASILKTHMFLNRLQFSKAKIEADKGRIFSVKHSTILHQLQFLGYRAEASILLDNIQEANECFLQAKKIIEQQMFIPPIFTASYFVAKLMADIQIIKKTITSNENFNIKKLHKNTYESGKDALKKLQKFAPHRVKILRLMGEYYWLIEKQRKAFKWWDKAIEKGEELGARPDLSRTYFEIGKALLDPKCSYKQWNGMSALEYLNKARNMFQEMDLRYDIDELDKIAANT